MIGGGAIKHVAATALAGIEPTDKETAEAVSEAIDLALGFLGDVRRIATAMERVAQCVDGGSFGPASFGTHEATA